MPITFVLAGNFGLALGGVMSARRKRSWLIGAFALCFFAGGANWWRGSYVNYLETGIHWETLVLMAGVSLFLSWIVGIGIVANAIAVAIALPAIVFTRVVLDCIDDPSSHNLWPFEVGLAACLGLIIAFLFAAVGTLLRHVTHRNQRSPADVDATRQDESRESE
jgi:lysylphosphatidylglycerol synthetase-like protein (DUF2156 family)